MAPGNSEKGKADDQSSKKPKNSKNNLPNHLSSAFIQPSYYTHQYLIKDLQDEERRKRNKK
jgi:hypothetical protein